MGPIRGRLILALAVATLTTTPALAAVCDTLRPGWSPDMGAITWWQEIWRVMASFPGLVVLASLAYGLWRPHLWISTACAAPALGFAALLALSERAETAVLARSEGCLGSVLPAAFLVLALGAFTIVRAWQRG